MSGVITFDRSIKIIIWLFGLAALTTLTVRDFLPILEDYRSNNVAIQVGVVVDDAFKAPRVVICIPFHKKQNDDLTNIARYVINSTEKCGICEKLVHTGWDVWNRANLTKFADDGIEIVYRAVVLQFMDEAVKVLAEQGEAVLRRDVFSNWGSPILSGIMYFFLLRQYVDYTLKEPYTFDGSPYTDELRLKLDSINSPAELDLLHTWVLEAFCQSLVFQEYTLDNEFEPTAVANSSCRELLLGNNVPTMFDFRDGLWFALPASNAPRVLLKLYHFDLLENGFIAWKPPEQAKKRPYYFYPDPTALYANIPDSLYISYIDKVNGHGSSLNVTIRYSVNMRAKDKRRDGTTPCLNETSETCYTRCTKVWIADKCNCIPFVYKRGMPRKIGLPYCNFTLYSACNISVIPEEAKENCAAECKNVCEHISYSWSLSTKTYEAADSANRSEFNLMVIPMITTFADFAWVPKITPEQFVSQVGGIANFYVGFSGLSIFASLVVVVDFWKRWSVRRKKMKDRQREGDCFGSAKEVLLDMCQNADQEEGIDSRFTKLESEIMGVKNLLLEMKSEKSGRKYF